MDAYCSGRIRGLDGLRGIGCCLVAFFWHYQHFGEMSSYPFETVFGPFYNWGGYAVELFLMLSGFTMELHYANKIKGREISFREYIWKRYKKLWPMATVTLLSVTILEMIYRKMTGTLFVIENFNLYHFILNLFLIQGGWVENSYSFNTPAWFISTLLICYIAFYVINYQNKRNERGYYRYIFVILVGLVAEWFHCTWPLLHYNFAARGYVCFFLGAVICRFEKEYKEKEYKNKAWIVPALGSVVLCIAVIVELSIQNHIVIPTFFSFVLFPTVIIAVLRSKLLQAILEWWPLRHMGRISMDVFLWHFSIQIALSMIFQQIGKREVFASAGFFLAYVLITVMGATVSSRVREAYRRRRLAC